MVFPVNRLFSFELFPIYPVVYNRWRKLSDVVYYLQSVPSQPSARSLFALPAHLEGLGISNLCIIATSEYSVSYKITEPLVDQTVH